MKCPNCNHENQDSNKFCAECGTKLVVPSTIVCPNCHSQVPADSKFCPDCGNRIEEASPSQEKDNRHIIEINYYGVVFKMIRVPHGSFLMGSDIGKENEKPVHKVTITKDYYIGETVVTQELWTAVMGDNPSFWGRKNGSFPSQWKELPVESVMDIEIEEFLEKLSTSNFRFRLPTEAEWEYAAIGAKPYDSYPYAGSYDVKDVAWYWDLDTEEPPEETHPVAQLQPNELGLYDMCGNVNEYCSDLYDYDNHYYENSPAVDPHGPEWGAPNVVRGGSYADVEDDCTVTSRKHHEPFYRSNCVGLRLVLEIMSDC